MTDKQSILNKIKNTVRKTDPKASLILYGSYAHGDYNEHSDLDLLVLLDQKKVTRTDQKRIKYPLYDIEFETGIIISPLALSLYYACYYAVTALLVSKRINATTSTCGSKANVWPSFYKNRTC